MALAAAIVLAGGWVALGSRGTLPDYDAVAYVHDAWRMRRTMAAGGVALVVAGLPFTNTLDALILAAAWEHADLHVLVWGLHTAYLLGFVLVARRLLGPAATLFLLGWCAAQGYFLHQYTSFISEMKVGLFLALFAVALFHPEARRHRVALFAITLVLLLLRALDLAFVGVLCAAFVAMRARDRWRARDIGAVAAAPLAAIAVASPVIVPGLVRLALYVRDTAGRTARNWADMSGVHDKAGLVLAYVRGLGEYNVAFQVAALAALFWIARRLARGRAGGLATLRDPALATACICATLLLAATTNIQVVFWPFVLEGVLAALLARAFLAPAAFLGIACIVGLWGGVQTARNVAGWDAAMRREAPAQSLARQMVAIVERVREPVVFENFGGYGPTDPVGLEIAAQRHVEAALADPVSYRASDGPYLEAFARANVAFVANAPFHWPRYWGVNRHTSRLYEAISAGAAHDGWERVQRLSSPGDPSHWIDVYLRGGPGRRAPPA